MTDVWRAFEYITISEKKRLSPTQSSSQPRRNHNRQLTQLHHKNIHHIPLPRTRIIPLRKPKLKPLHQQRKHLAHLRERKVLPRAVGMSRREWDERLRVVDDFLPVLLCGGVER